MAKKNFSALLLTAALLTGMTSIQANAVDMGISGKFNLPNVPIANYQTPQQQAVQTQPRSLAENKTNTELYQTVKTIGNKILQANNINTSVNFKLVEQAEANAATTADNTVYVFTGLLKECQNEDELAYVIGHEIGHAVKSHVIKGALVNATVSTGATVGNQILNNKIASSGFEAKMSKIGLGGLTSSAANSAVNVTANAAMSKISRGQKKDADILSIDFIVKAGYNPAAALNIMERIGENYNDLFADHPSTDKRIVTMTNYIQEKYPQYLNNNKSYNY